MIRISYMQQAPMGPNTCAPSTVGCFFGLPSLALWDQKGLRPPSDAWGPVSEIVSLVTVDFSTAASLSFASSNSVCLPSPNTNCPRKVIFRP